jgi:hypothetical protein
MSYILFSTAPQPKSGNILFVKGEVQGGDRDIEPLPSHEINPDEIDIDADSSSEDEANDDEGKSPSRQVVGSIPAEVK